MRILFLFGLPLLIAAFLAGAAELAAVGKLGEGRLFLSARDTWSTLWPDSLASFQAWAEATSPILWDPVAMMLLELPGWLILGGPGAVLTWFGRPHRIPEDEGPDEDSLFLYDELVKQAREEGFGANHDEPLEHDVDLEAGDHDPDLAGDHDDLAPQDHAHLDSPHDDVEVDEGEDDRAPSSMDDYRPPEADEIAWEAEAAEAAKAGEPEEPEDRPHRPAQPIPEPPTLNGRHWVPPPPAADSGRDKDD